MDRVARTVNRAITSKMSAPPHLAEWCLNVGYVVTVVSIIALMIAIVILLIE